MLSAPTAFAAEVGSLSLEFKTLSEFTGDCRFADAADAVLELVDQAAGVGRRGLVPAWLEPRGAVPVAHSNQITLGSRGDSFYEYLAKEFILTGKICVNEN